MTDTHTSAGLDLTAPPGRPDITVRQIIDAPRELVFRAVTDPELLPRWWGPHGSTLEVQQMEARAGGRWRYLHHSPDGAEARFHGVFHELTPPERAVWTFEYDAAPGEVALETLTLEEVDGGDRTRYVTASVFPTVEARDAALASGMVDGIRQSMERLETLTSELRG